MYVISFQDGWEAISASNDFVELYKIDPSTPLDSTLIDPPGHWELTSVTSTQVLDQQVDHLIPVSWGQSSPYNMFCPNRTDNNAIKTPAGCVALSGAQTLAYLQDLMDLNISVPSTVVSSGNVDAFEIQFSDFGTTLWNNIYTNDTSAASLIAYIGYLVNIEYGNNDIWYTPTEDWAANLGSSWESFKYNKNMIYGFSKL